MKSVSTGVDAKVEAATQLLKKVSNDFQHIVFANSLGAEDMVLMDLIVQSVPHIQMISLDTGRLPIETYTLMEEIEQRYGRVVKYYYPEAQAIEQYTRSKGINAFYHSIELRKECCHIRKVEPLRRALKGQQAWITGLRRAQSVTRTSLEAIEFDDHFGIPKVSPLLDWQESEIWEYIKAKAVPYNALHDQHYPSIGCAPCTRAIAKGEELRAGRWWWENPESKECGLHILQKPAA